MQKIIQDFVVSGRLKSGVGIFKGDVLAAEMAGKMNRNQVRKAERYGHVPKALFEYLHEKKITAKLEDSLTEYLILELLWRLLRDPQNKMSDEDLSWAASTSLSIGRRFHPDIKKGLADQSRLWVRLETYRRPCRNKAA